MRRAAVRLPLRLWTEGLVDGRLDFHNCSNLSVGGIFIENPVPYDVGQVVQIEFNLPGVYDSVKVTGDVVSRIDPDETGTARSGNGFKFLDLGDADRELIEKFIETSIEEDEVF
jgi:Tfp pilus assembly protein PilZ